MARQQIQDYPVGDAPLPLFDDAVVIFVALLVALGIICLVELVIRWRRGRRGDS